MGRPSKRRLDPDDENDAPSSVKVLAQPFCYAQWPSGYDNGTSGSSLLPNASIEFWPSVDIADDLSGAPQTDAVPELSESYVGTADLESAIE